MHSLLGEEKSRISDSVFQYEKQKDTEGRDKTFYKSMTVRIGKTRRVYNDAGNAPASQDLGVTILINSIRT